MDLQSENMMRKYMGLPPIAGNEEVGASFDGADAACACDAAPKKQQTLEQHLRQYHGGKMPTGDCKFLKQYKKDHPDWQKDAVKVSKGEAAVDTVKKDAPKGKKVSPAEFMKTAGFKKGSLVNYRMASVFSHDVWEITGLQPNGRITIKRVRDGMGRKVAKGIEIEVDATRCKTSVADAAHPEWKTTKSDGGDAADKNKGKDGDEGNGKKKEISKEVLERCDRKMSDEEVYALREMASDKNTSADVLKKLAFAEHYTSANANCEIQEAVANNPNTPNDILKHLSGFPRSNEDYKGKAYRNDVAESAKATLAAKKKDGASKKSSAEAYTDAVKKDADAKKSSVGKKENLDDKGRYIPTQEEIDAACQAMSDSFDFSKEGVAKMVKDLIAGNRVWQGKDGGLLDIVQAMKGKGGVVRAIKERAKEQFIRDDHPWFKEDFWKNK